MNSSLAKLSGTSVTKQILELKRDCRREQELQLQHGCEVHLQLGKEKQGPIPISAFLTLLRLLSGFCPFNVQNELYNDRTLFRRLVWFLWHSSQKLRHYFKKKKIHLILSQSIPVMAADQVHTSYLSAKCIENYWTQMERGRGECLIIELYLSHPQRFEHHFDLNVCLNPLNSLT